MKLSRRLLLKAGLGATQIGLLSKFGLWGSKARAASGIGPDRLLTLFLPGGWMPSYVWSPLTPAQIARVIPPPQTFANERVFYTSSEVTNLDGTGDQLDSSYPRLRMP